jgi:hypothetical protein
MLQQTYKHTDSSGGKQADMQQDTLAVGGSTSMTAAATALNLQMDSLSPVSEGFVGDPWLSITTTFCHVSLYASDWFVLEPPCQPAVLLCCLHSHRQEHHPCHILPCKF